MMFIWVGADVDCQIAEIKSATYIAEKEIGFKNSNFTLPFHISLKISFPVSDDVAQNVIYDVENIYRAITRFEIEIDKIECHENICWIRYKQNDVIDSIHDKLNSMLLEKYGVGLHEYDCDYKFHTTLFMDDDSSKVKKAYDIVKNVYVPSSICINKLVIGASDSGGLGTYKVVREVNI